MPPITEFFEELTKGLRSSEGELLKSEGGKLFYDTFKDMIPDLEKTAQGIHDTHLNWYNTGRITSPPDPNKALEMAKTLVEPKYLGRNKEIITQAVELASKRNKIHAQNVADIASISLRETGTQAWRAKVNPALGVKSASPYTSASELERSVKKFTGLTLLGRVAIPHSMQSINTLLNEGVSAWSKAAYDMATDYQGAKKFGTTVGALFGETLQEYHNHITGAPSWISKLFYMPGFSLVRKAGIIHAAVAGRYAAEDAAEEYFKSGGLKRAAELTLKFHGLDPAQILKQSGKLTQDQIDKAAYNSVNESFPIRDLKTPWIWAQNPTNRLLFLYKNFQFREGKIIQNAIVRGFRGGPVSFLKTMAILTTAFPIAGEIIGDMSSLATGHGLDRDKTIKHWTGNPAADLIIDDMAHVAGFGIGYSIARSTGYMQLAQWLLGPVVGMIPEAATDIISAAKGKPRPLERSLTRRVPVIGSALTNTLLPPEQKGRHKHSHVHKHVAPTP